MEQAFQNYDWDNDPEWQKILRSLEISPTLDEKAVILARKRKYYKAKVDPNYEPPANASSSSSSSPSSSASASASSSSSSSSSSSRTSSSSSSSSSYYNRSSSYGSSSSSSSASSSSGSFSPFASWRDPGSDPFSGVVQMPAPRDVTLAPIPGQLGTLCAILYTIITILSLVYFIPLLPSSTAYTVYYWAIKLTCIADAVHAFTALGRPRLTQDYAAQLAQDERVHHFLMALVQIAGPMSFLGLIPCFIRSLAYSLTQFKGAAAGPSRAFADSIDKFTFLPEETRTRMKTMLRELVTSNIRSGQVDSLVAYAEVVLALAQIPLVFTPAGSILFLLIVWQLMRMRYFLSPYVRRAFNFFHNRVFLPALRTQYVPQPVLRGYQFITDKAWSFVDPVQIQQAAQQAQQGGSQGGGLMGNCTIA